MLTLFIQDNCAYSTRVVEKLHKLKLKAHIKNIANDAFAIELLWHGGKEQVPYLIDDTHEADIYEADAIIAHLEKHYAKKL